LGSAELPADAEVRVLDGDSFEKLAERLRDVVQWFDVGGVSSPYVVFLTILNAQGRKFRFEPGGFHNNKPGFDRSRLNFPGVLVEDAGMDLTLILKQLFDMVRKAAGWDADPYFDKKGHWRLSV
jgi:hypothetical protein